jgi:hypothetical protein
VSLSQPRQTGKRYPRISDLEIGLKSGTTKVQPRAHGAHGTDSAEQKTCEFSKEMKKLQIGEKRFIAAIPTSAPSSLFTITSACVPRLYIKGLFGVNKIYSGQPIFDSDFRIPLREQNAVAVASCRSTAGFRESGENLRKTKGRRIHPFCTTTNLSHLSQIAGFASLD